MSTRILIIGAGALGLSTAYHCLLADPSAQVTVLEAQHIASGSSSRSVGIVETQYMDRFDIQVRAYGRRFFDSLSSEHGLQFTRNGYMRLAHNDSDLQAYERSVQVQAEEGVSDARVLSPVEVQRLVPDMVLDGRVGALWGPSDGYADGHLYCSLLADLIANAGGLVLQRAPVIGIESRGELIRVRTAEQALEADVVVNASGAWAARVGELCDAPVPLIPQRHSALVVQLSGPLEYMMPSVMDYVPGSGRSGLYFRHERRDQLVAGLHTEEPLEGPADPDRYPQGTTEEFTTEVAEQLAERLPSIEGGIAHGWSGLYPMTPDHQPIVGAHPNNRAVINAVGAGGNGIQLSPAIGRAVAAELFGTEGLDPLGFARWSAARLMSTAQKGE